MNVLKLYSWGVINKTGDAFLNPLEQDIRDCCIVGKTYVQILHKSFTYRVETCPIQRVYNGKDGFFVQALNKDIFELVGEPSSDYARLFHIDRAKFADVVTKKLKLT